MDQETYLLIEKIVYAICYQMERSLLLEDQIGMVSSLAEDVAQLSNRCAVYSRNTLPSSTSCIKQFCITNLIIFRFASLHLRRQVISFQFPGHIRWSGNEAFSVLVL